MKNLRVRKSRAVRPAGLAIPALAVSAVVALAVAGAAEAKAATGHKDGRASHSRRVSGFERPRLGHHRLVVAGTEAGDRIALRLEAGRPDVLQVDVGDDGSADFSFHLEPVEGIVVDARGGDDLVRIDEGNGAFTNSIPTTIAGGDGNDTLAGGSGAELFFGGDGNDSIDGNGGTDVALLGSGDDSFVWDPGDGSDTIEGQDGNDRMVFNGAAAAEHVELSANGNRLKFVRDPGNITMDTHGVERVDFNALGGADVVTIDDLTGTDVGSVNVDLAGALGGAAGDGQADRVIVKGTDRNDTINVGGDAGGVKVSGPAATVEVLHSEVANDRLEIDTLAGRDIVDSAGLGAGAIQLLVNGVLTP